MATTKKSTGAVKNAKTTAKTAKQATIPTVVIDITTRENKLLQALIEALYAEPGFTDVDVNDLARSTKFSVEVTKGLVGSLVKKGILDTIEIDNLDTPKWEGVTLSPEAFNLHTNESWGIEAPDHGKLEKIINVNVVPDTKSANSKKTTEKSVTKKAAAKKSEEVKEVSNRPYSVYGIHGKNVELEGFTKGDEVKFMLKGTEVTGVFVHFHVNNWSKKGYAVIKIDKKIYERTLGKFTKVEKKEVKKTTTKKATPVKTNNKPAPAKKATSTETKATRATVKKAAVKK